MNKCIKILLLLLISFVFMDYINAEDKLKNPRMEPFYAILESDTGKLKKWLEYNSPNYMPGQIPLAAATVSGGCHIESLKLLISSGLDVNQKDLLSGSSLLHSAVENSNLSCMKILIENGADLKVHDKKNRNLYWYAVLSNNKEAIKILFKAGLSPLTKSSNDLNAIDLAKKLDRMYLFDFLENPEAGY